MITITDEHVITTELEAAEAQWPVVAAGLGLTIVMHNDEWHRDRVQAADDAVYYRVEFDGRWHRQGWSNASAARLQRDVPLSLLAQEGARHRASAPSPTGTDDDRS